MTRENIMFFKNDGESYTMVDLYLHSRSFTMKILIIIMILMWIKHCYLKKSENECFIRYNDVNKMKIVPLQLKIKNFYNELITFGNNNRVMFIYNDDKEFFRKCREIWKKITELIGINNSRDFVETDSDYDDEFITADVHENISFALEDNYMYGHNKA